MKTLSFSSNSHYQTWMIDVPNLNNNNNMEICNYLNLQSIVVKENSLNNLNSLKICNSEELSSIDIEDGSFSNVLNLIIESIWFVYNWCLYLPNLQSFESGYITFYNTTSLSLSSNSISSTDYYIFPIYNHSKQEIIHSIKQQVYLFQVIILKWLIIRSH